MSLKKYLILMIIGTVFSWLAWFLVVRYINPEQTGSLGFLFFYISLFLSLVGTFSLIGFLARFLLIKDKIIRNQLSISLRQSFLFTFLIIGLLFLQSKRLLTWWNIALLIMALTVLEFFLISYRSSRLNNKQ